MASKLNNSYIKDAIKAQSLIILTVTIVIIYKLIFRQDMYYLLNGKRFCLPLKYGVKLIYEDLKIRILHPGLKSSDYISQEQSILIYQTIDYLLAFFYKNNCLTISHRFLYELPKYILLYHYFSIFLFPSSYQSENLFQFRMFSVFLKYLI